MLGERRGDKGSGGELLLQEWLRREDGTEVRSWSAFGCVAGSALSPSKHHGYFEGKPGRIPSKVNLPSTTS